MGKLRIMFNRPFVGWEFFDYAEMEWDSVEEAVEYIKTVKQSWEGLEDYMVVKVEWWVEL